MTQSQIWFLIAGLLLAFLCLPPLIRIRVFIKRRHGRLLQIGKMSDIFYVPGDFDNDVDDDDDY